MADYSDAFDGSNAWPYTGGQWVQALGNSMELYNNVLYCHEVVSVRKGIWYWNQTFANDQYTEVVISAAGPRDVNLILRAGATDCVFVNLYNGDAYPGRIAANVLTENISTITFTNKFASGDTARLSVTGNLYTIANVTDGESHTFTDTTRSGGFAGIYIPVNSDGFVSWAGGDLAGDVTAPTYGTDPAAGTITNTTAAFSATASDETATHVDHYMSIYAAASTPTAANAKAGTGTGFVGGTNKSSLNVANGAAATFGGAATGLSPGTNYRAAFTVEEQGGGTLATVYYVDFKTAPTLAITAGHLTLTGATLTLSAAAVDTKVSFTIKQAWDNSNFASETGIGYAVYAFNMATQSIDTELAAGVTETTDGSGVIEVETTLAGHLIGDDVLVLFWQLAGGPAGENIIGASFETLVAL